MWSNKTPSKTPTSTPGLSTQSSTQLGSADEDGTPTVSTADMQAPDYSYSFLKGLDTTSPFRPRTVAISKAEFENMGNMERQYWEIKSEHFDIVVFFKKGKFYELYDCDAVIANKEFGLKMVCDSSNRGKMRMAGVPEQTFSEWARLFVFRGYKIGRVEQMTVGGDDDDDEASASPAKAAAKVKIVPRDLVQIITSGTVSDPSMINGHDALFVLVLVPAIREVVTTSTPNADDSGAATPQVTASTPTTSFQLGIDAMAVDVSRNIIYTCPSYTTAGDLAPDVAIAHLLDLVQGLFLRLNPKEVIVPTDDAAMLAAIKCATALRTGASKLLTVNENYLQDRHAFLSDVSGSWDGQGSSPFPSLSDMLKRLQRLAKNGFAATNGGEGTTYEEVSEEGISKYRKAQLKLLQAALDSHANSVKGSSPAAATPATCMLGTYFSYLKLTNFDLSQTVPFVMHCGNTQSSQEGGAVSQLPPNTPHTAAKASSSLLLRERRNDLGVFLDAAAIENIELVANLRDGSVKHSIYNHLCKCSTSSGKRMFRGWLLRPLSSATAIRHRQDAVKGGIMEGNLYDLWAEIGGTTATTLGKKRAREGATQQASQSPLSQQALSKWLPKHLFAVDFERQLSRLSLLKNENARVAYVDPMLQYNQNLDLILTSIDVFTELETFAKLATTTFERSVVGDSPMPPLLKELLDKMLLVGEPLRKVLSSFDAKKAAKDREVKPQKGMIAAYDEAVEQLSELAGQFETVRKEFFCLTFGTKEVAYTDLGKDLFLLEIPLAAYSKVEKNLPIGAYTERARTTKFVKLIAKGLEEHVTSFKKHTATKSNGLVMVLRHLAGVLCEGFPAFFEAVTAFSYLDCLMSLVTVHHQSLASGGSCFPTIVEASASAASDGSFIKATDLYHPMIPQPVSNTVDISPESARVLLLTGPNMAGKSTMMRTIALAFLAGQLGGPVAASECTLCPVTRIFTRIGARDAQHRGQSTLFVELKEMAEICNYSDNFSLCLVDELGRGTSTHDGYAIAHATLRYLAGGDQNQSHLPSPAQLSTQQQGSAKRPLVIFSTHYHALAIDVAQQQENKHRPSPSFETDNATNSAASFFDHAAIQLGYMDFALQSYVKGSGSGEEPGLPSAENSVVSLRGIGEASNGARSAPVVQKITFLYKMVKGICHRSYGVEVAAVAGIPSAILRVAQQKSRMLASATTRHQVVAMMKQLAKATSDEELLVAARKASVIIAATKATS